MTVKMFLSELDLSLHVSHKNAFLNTLTLPREDAKARFSSIAQMEKDYFYSTSICLSVNSAVSNS